MKGEGTFTYENSIATKNPLTGDWLVYDRTPKGPYGTHDVPYICTTKNGALQMLLTVAHYAKTGEQKAFSVKEAKEKAIKQ